MKEFDIEVHRVDDWECVYVNGKAECQSHSDQLEEFLYHVETPFVLKSVVRHYWEGDAVDKLISRVGCFPEDLSELDEFR